MPDCSTCGAPGFWCEERREYRCSYHWPSVHFSPEAIVRARQRELTKPQDDTPQLLEWLVAAHPPTERSFRSEKTEQAKGMAIKDKSARIGHRIFVAGVVVMFALFMLTMLILAMTK